MLRTRHLNTIPPKPPPLRGAARCEPFTVLAQDNFSVTANSGVMPRHVMKSDADAWKETAANAGIPIRSDHVAGVAKPMECNMTRDGRASSSVQKLQAPFLLSRSEKYRSMIWVIVGGKAGLSP